MTRYVVLLRGINLGKRRIPMPELKALAAELGHTEVSTYIASGNLILSSDRRPTAIAAELDEAIAQRYGFDVDCAIRTAAELAAVVATNPFPQGDPKQVTVGFAATAIEKAADQRIAALASPDERFQIAGREVYVDFAGGLARSKLAVQLGKAVGQPITTRNARTVASLSELANR
ncbi:hypothetical protein GCM10011575_11490 [Microlunatus endophyticus]|uniref:DUF1697 domain-containing protein n=1 Tax=Microlunatus endophyticus TaxID=1716077 RepID=A0A917W2N7_9ACTN|nr:DUF1697 domain-containing protein [Microlunatus endophyticus]GGL54832.1 hypothetical protein GCM10011575_11490 [Microlunatus endophyticus]